MHKNSKLALKSLGLLLVAFIALYIAFWFIAANDLRKKLQIHEYALGVWSVSYKQADISGFPFKLGVKLSDGKFMYNSLAGSKAEVAFDTIKAETNLLFNYIDFTLPHNFSFDFETKETNIQRDIITEGVHRLKISETNLINTYKIAKFLYKADSKFPAMLLNKLEYQADNSHITDRKTGQEILSGESDLNLSLDYNSDGVSIKYKSFNEINFLSEGYFGHKFHKLITKLDLEMKAKEQEKNHYALPLLKLNLLDLELDKSHLSLVGDFENLAEPEMKFTLDLKLKGWDIFVQELLEQNIISINQQAILNDTMQQITGNAVTSEADIKINSEQDGFTKIGNSKANNIFAHVIEFLSSK